jgi:signal peptidase
MTLALGGVAALFVAAVVIFWPQQLGGSVAFVSVKGISMTPTLREGDLVVVRSAPDYRVGDIIAFTVPPHYGDAGLGVIHRIIGGNAVAGYIAKGDHNPVPDPWRLTAGDIIGKEWFHIPGFAGWASSLRWIVPVLIVGGLLVVLALLLRRRRVRSEERAST